MPPGMRVESQIFRIPKFYCLQQSINKLLSGKEMLACPEAIQAVRKEASGLESKGIWDVSTAREAEAVKEEACRSGRKVHLGSLRSICSIKFVELAKHLQIYQGRLVYRGDCATDEWGAAALFQGMATSVPTSLPRTLL